MSNMSISVDEIVEIHLRRGLKNINRTMNPFMIYRKNYALQNPNLSLRVVSKLASVLWKNESNEIKDHYRLMAKNVKKEFKKKVTSRCFIHSNLTNTNDNETNPPMDHSPNTIRPNYPLNTNQNSSGTTYYNPPMDINEGSSFRSHMALNPDQIIYINQGTSFPNPPDYSDHPDDQS